MASNQAWVTLATNDTYAMGALVLSASLKKVNTTRSKAILVTPDVTAKMRTLLTASYDLVQEVDLINSNDDKILAAMKRPELGVTLTKIHCWTLTQYEKAVFLDADTLLVQNSDELFDREELSAVPDIGWPDCFNTGVFVFKPSVATFVALAQMAASEGSFDGGDQGLLNQYFSQWNSEDISKHLSFVYNMTLIAVYSYPPAYRRFGKNVKIVHFLGSLKPWLYGYDPKSKSVLEPSSSQSSQQLEHVQSWWDIFVADVKPQLSDECAGLAATLASVDLSSETSPQHKGSSPTPSESVQRRKAWEAGVVDYMGTDGYEAIQKKLDASLGLPSSS